MAYCHVMDTFEQRVIHLFEQIHPLDRIARAGYVLRGVPEPESVSAHSHFVSLLTLLFVDAFPAEFDRSKAITLALIHDLAEAKLMDTPMPAVDQYLHDLKDQAEIAVIRDLFAPFDSRYAEYFQELVAASSPEACLIRGLDKAQMMLKIVMYQREGKGRLDEFWVNPKNFNDFGVPAVDRLFDALCAWAGKPRPRYLA